MPRTTSRSARNSRFRRVQFASGVNGAPNLPSRSVWLISQSRSRGRCPARIEARARLLTSAILTPAGQAVVHQPQPEHQSTVRSGVCTCMPSRLIGHRGGEPEALGLRTHVLGAREPIVDPRDRAHLVADVALEALVGRQPDGLVERLLHDRGDRHRTASALRLERFGFEALPTMDAAARQALASATPSPQRSTITRWPASSPPTIRTLS